MGVLGCRPLGCGGPAVRLPFPFLVPPHLSHVPSPFSQLLPVCHQGFSSVCCVDGLSRVRGNNTCSSFHDCLLLLVLALVAVSSSLPLQYHSVVRFRLLSLFVYRLPGVFCACLWLFFGLLHYLALLFTTLCRLGSSSLIPFSPLFLSCQWFSCIFWLVDIFLLWFFLPLRFLPGSPVVSTCLSCSWISFWSLGALLSRSNLRFPPRRGPPFGPSQLPFRFSALLLVPCPAPSLPPVLVPLPVGLFFLGVRAPPIPWISCLQFGLSTFFILLWFPSRCLALHLFCSLLGFHFLPAVPPWCCSVFGRLSLPSLCPCSSCLSRVLFSSVCSLWHVLLCCCFAPSLFS